MALPHRPREFDADPREAEAYFLALVEASQDAILVTDDDARILYASPRSSALFLRTADELIDTDLHALMKLSSAAFSSLWQRVLRGDSVCATVRLRDDAGREIEIEMDGAPCTLPQRQILILRDITERQRIERQLLISQERLATALAVGCMGAYDNDLIHQTLWWSPELYILYGVDAATFVPTLESFRRLVHVDDFDRLLTLRAESIAQRQPIVHEFRIVRPDGEVRWISNRAKTAYDLAGVPIRHFGIALDVTERKRTEQALRDQASVLNQADQRKNQFLAMLAHELRGPLAPMQSAIQIMQRSLADLSEVQHAADIMERQVKHFRRLVDDLLDVARVSSGKVRLQREAVDLRRVLAQAIEMSQPWMLAKQHRLEVLSSPVAVMVLGDATRLAQVFCNLLDNAAKYTDAGGRIKVSLDVVVSEGSPLKAVIEVSDNGHGIAPEVQQSLFDLFYQAEANLAQAEGGLGIGLSLVKALVALHGGQIFVHSQGVGQGSLFCVELPLLPFSQAVLPATLAPRRSPLAPSRILVVDDHLDAADSLTTLLALDGHDTRMTHDGPSALKLALEWRPDFILLDLGLPTQDGYAVCEALRAEGLSEATIVAVTGYGALDGVEGVSRVGFDGHLVKPVDADTLLGYLHSVRRQAPMAGAREAS